MLGVSGMLGSSDDGAAAATEARESGGKGSSSNGGGGEVGGVAGPSTGGLSEEEKVGIGEGDRNSGGNRWPRQETLALLKIRSDMDGAFRDSSLKGPLWEEVSRKLAELGYHRSAKKCKEKFENVYKYHKRTKDGRSSKPDGKTYRFFDQLEALENQPPPPQPFLPPPRSQTTTLQPPTPATPVSVALPGTNPPITVSHVSSTVPSNPIILSQNIVNPTNAFPSNPLPIPPPPAVTATATIGSPTNLPQTTTIPASTYANMSLNLGSISTSSSTSSDEDPERGRKRKRKWEHFFQRLMKEVVEKQEEMQKKFLETLERRERDRVAREEAWRVQEMARMNREHDLLVQERSMAAAKDAAVIAFLQKVSDQQIPNVAQLQRKIQVQQGDNPITQPPPPPRQPIVQKQPPPPPQPQPQSQLQLMPHPVENVDNPKTDNGGENLVPTSSSRWPKAEVEALIRLRTSMDTKYQESGPKGPLWEEMSAAMARIGYSRSAKRCKEKWENINKYFKKVKESNKRRPEDSKTCPYFHQLDAIYKEKAKSIDNSNSLNPMIPIMVQPEQQWPLPPQEQQQQQHQHQHQPGESSAMEDRDSENVGDDNDDGDDEEDEEDEAGGYEIVTSKASSVGAAE